MSPWFRMYTIYYDFNDECNSIMMTVKSHKNVISNIKSFFLDKTLYCFHTTYNVMYRHFNNLFTYFWWHISAGLLIITYIQKIRTLLPSKIYFLYFEYIERVIIYYTQNIVYKWNVVVMWSIIIIHFYFTGSISICC